MTSVTDIYTQLERDEGLRLHPYTDTRGFVTIGYGRNLSTEGISQQEAKGMLEADVTNTGEALRTALPWFATLQDNDWVRAAVLINMAFNLGVHGLLTFNTFLSLVESQQYDAAADDMLQTPWATEVGARAQRLALQLRTGQWQ